MSAIPATGPAGLRDNARFDAVSGFMVFLVALPLCLGISMASGFPPIAGVFTAVVGGLLGVFLGSAPMTIKGPAAGLIVIVVGAVNELGGGDPVLGYRRALAVGVVAALLQIGFALLRAGRLGEVFPVSVVHGMLAAIGIIIFSKQLHIMLGVKPEAKEPLELLAEIPHSIQHLNPGVALIGLLGFLILMILPRLPFAAARRIPGPLVVLLVAVPLGQLLGLGAGTDLSWGGSTFHVGPEHLVRLPDSLLGAVTFPDFSAIFEAASIKYVIMYALVGSVESLLSAKAVESMDPWKRRSDLDRDLLAVGVANLLAAMIGGLPMISEIVRSSANAAAGARTSWSNFFHGAFLLLFVAFLPGLVQMIPLAALAAMLVYTGTRLASPAEYKHTWHIGREQMVVFGTTLMLTLATDLLIGVAAGILVKVLLHLYHGAPIATLLRPPIRVDQRDDEVVIQIEGAAVFTNYLSIRPALRQAVMAGVSTIVIDFGAVNLIDHTVMEKIQEIESEVEASGRNLRRRGLDGLSPLSSHPLAARRRA